MGAALPLGPVPELTGISATLIRAENATGLFPAITPVGVGSTVVGASNASGLFPAVTPSPVPAGPPPRAAGAAGAAGHSGRSADAVIDAAVGPAGMPLVTIQVIGLVMLALAILLAVTRLSLRRRGPGA